MFLGKDSWCLEFNENAKTDIDITSYLAEGYLFMAERKPVDGTEYICAVNSDNEGWGLWVEDNSIQINKERKWRDSELVNYVDSLQKVLVWGDMADDQKDSIILYRRELLDYPNQVDFPNGIRPTRPNI